MQFLTCRAAEGLLPGVSDSSVAGYDKFVYENVNIDGEVLNGIMTRVENLISFDVKFNNADGIVISFIATINPKEDAFEATVNGQKCMIPVPPMMKDSSI